MNRSQSKLLVFLLGLLILAAGFTSGLLARRIGGSGSSKAMSHGSGGLVDELQLTPMQQDQMRVIWEAVRSEAQNSYQDAQELQSRRDQALVAILDDRQKAEFEKISKDFAARFVELSQKRDRAFDAAVARTKQLLDDKQRAKYERILSARVRQNLRPGALGIASPAELNALSLTDKE